MIYKDLIYILTDVFTLGGAISLVDMFCLGWLFKHLLIIVVFFFRKLWKKEC